MSVEVTMRGQVSNFEIRYISEFDGRLAISRVYEESWKYAYKGIVPQDYLDGIPAGQWASNIEQKGRNNLVMVLDGTIIGTSGFGRSRIAEIIFMGAGRKQKCTKFL